jgi:hypothetical protein
MVLVMQTEIAQGVQTVEVVEILGGVPFWLDHRGEMRDLPAPMAPGSLSGAAPGRCRTRSDAVTGKSFWRGAGLMQLGDERERNPFHA